ncbi:MAG: RHS repeat-associated core domain-containing protein [Thermodesulfobacteriota bacterium]
MRFSRAILTALVVLLLVPGNSSGAGRHVPNVRPEVRPLDLTKTPTVEQLMSAGQLGGQLYPTGEIAETEKQNEINQSFGVAIQAWNRHQYKKAVQLFKKHIASHPDSPWAAEADLHLGCEARYNGRYAEAEEHFNRIISTFGNNPYPGAVKLVDKANLRLGVLHVLRNDFPAAAQLFSRLEKEGTDWRSRTYAAHWLQRLRHFKAEGLSLLKCGVQALAYILEKDGEPEAARQILDLPPGSEKGHSLANLMDIAGRYGYSLEGLLLQPHELSHLPLPAILQLNGSQLGESGHYWVLEQITDSQLTLYDPQSRRHFQQSPAEFAKHWDGVALADSGSGELPGSVLPDADTGRIFGGCCGVPRPESDLGPPPCPDGGTPTGGCSSCGAPVWKVNMVNMNLYVKDTPLWYTPPIGPPVRIALSYNSQSAIASNETFGNKWQFNYGSYLVVDPGGDVLVFMPEGQRHLFTDNGAGSYDRPYRVYDELIRIGDNHYQLRLQNGTVYEYDIPAGTDSLQPFLVSIRDAYGQALTFGYNPEVELETITDATGRVTTLVYNAEGLVERVDDPFGRSARFEYDTDRNLTRITDMGGFWSSFRYDRDVYLAGIGNSRGEYRFYIEPSDIINHSIPYPAPGDPMAENYRITITNPEGGMEEYQYNGTFDNEGRYISPKHYLAWRNPYQNNYRADVPVTRYHYKYGTEGGEIATITYPDGGSVKYTFDPLSHEVASITDAHGHARSFTYNDNGRAASSTDQKGTMTSYTYAANGVDLISITNGLGTTSLTHNDSHGITSVTNLLGKTTGPIEYNAYGQITAVTDALGQTTSFVYDTGTHLLQEVQRSGMVLESFGYDPVGRVASHTDAAGVTLTYEYDDLDQITRVTYPDGRFEQFVYGTCCPGLLSSITDRAGRTTTFLYDNMKRLIEETNSEGGRNRYGYDANGNLTEFTDPNGNSTRFEYDDRDQLVKRIYADGKATLFSYDKAGLPVRRVDARGVVTEFYYDANDLPAGRKYSDSTATVTLQRDEFNRVTTIRDGAGKTTYRYFADSSIKTVDGPWPNDTITYAYDDLGRVTTVTPQGGRPRSYHYDGFDRLAGVVIGGGTFSCGYTPPGAGPLIASLTRPNGSRTTYRYDDPLKRLTEIAHRNSTGEVISTYAYTYNQTDQRDSETVTNGPAVESLQAGTIIYQYNRLNQLLASTPPVQPFLYDDAGNMTQGYTPEGYRFTAAHDAENRLSSLTFTDSAGIAHRNEYTYTADNLLARVQEFENATLVSDTRIVRDGFLALQDRDGDNTVVREYAWGQHLGGGIGGLLALRQDDQDYAYLYDGRGNVTGIIDSNQAPVASYRYDAFGRLLSSPTGFSQPFQYSTKRYDAATGLSYFGYRYYAAGIGRWTSRDPIGERGGVNLYGYVSNDPVDWVDPLGLSQMCHRDLLLPVPYARHCYARFDDGTTSSYDQKGVHPDPDPNQEGTICTEPKQPEKDDCIKKTMKKCKGSDYSFTKFNCCHCLEEAMKECGVAPIPAGDWPNYPINPGPQPGESGYSPTPTYGPTLGD